MSYLLIAFRILLGIAATDLYTFNQYRLLLGGTPTATPLGHFMWILIGHPSNNEMVHGWALIFMIFAVFFIIVGILSAEIKFQTPSSSEKVNKQKIKQIIIKTESPRGYFSDLTQFIHNLEFSVVSNDYQ